MAQVKKMLLGTTPSDAFRSISHTCVLPVIDFSDETVL